MSFGTKGWSKHLNLKCFGCDLVGYKVVRVYGWGHFLVDHRDYTGRVISRQTVKYPWWHAIF